MSQRHGLRARRRHSGPNRRSHAPTDVQATQAPRAKLYGGELSKEPLMVPDIQAGSIGRGHILPGSIDLDLFAETIVPPRVVGALPPLPDADYPEGTLAFLTTDGKLYRNVADVWDSSVDGGDIVADSITAGSIASGAIGTEQLAADAVIANVVNVGGTVTIDDEGITIADEFGATGLTAQGFAGSWLAFLRSGLYNNQFEHGNDGPMTYAQLPSAAEVPYWYFNTRSHTSVTATRVAAASAPGGSVISIAQTVGDPGVAAYGLLHQNALIRCEGGRAVTGRVAWRAVGAELSETQRIRFNFIWLDKDQNILSITAVNTDARTTTGPAGVYEWAMTVPVDAPGDANYFVPVVGGRWDLGSSDGTTSIEIAEVAIDVGSHVFRELSFNEDVQFEWVTNNYLRLISTEDDLYLRMEVPGDTGTDQLLFYVEGDIIERLSLGLNAGAPRLYVGDGAGNIGTLDFDGHLNAHGNVVADSDGEPITLSQNGYIILTERSAGIPANADANTARLYVRDVGGKTSLRARFPSGTEVTIATEP